MIIKASLGDDGLFMQFVQFLDLVFEARGQRSGPDPLPQDYGGWGISPEEARPAAATGCVLTVSSHDVRGDAGV